MLVTSSVSVVSESESSESRPPLVSVGSMVSGTTAGSSEKKKEVEGTGVMSRSSVSREDGLTTSGLVLVSSF